MNRLLRTRARLVVGIGLLLAAVVVLSVGYSSIHDEIYVAIQLPYLLSAGVGALICAGAGLVLLRSQDEAATRERLLSLEAAHYEMSDRFEALGVQVEYATQLLEAALGDEDPPPKVERPSSPRDEVRI